MRTVRIASNAATASWLVDKDCVLTGAVLASSTANKACVSSDPSQTVTDLESPASSFTIEMFVIYLRMGGASTTSANIYFENLNIPLEGGRTIYVSFSTAGSVILLLDEPLPI